MTATLQAAGGAYAAMSITTSWTDEDDYIRFQLVGGAGYRIFFDPGQTLNCASYIFGLYDTGDDMDSGHGYGDGLGEYIAADSSVYSSGAIRLEGDTNMILRSPSLQIDNQHSGTSAGIRSNILAKLALGATRGEVRHFGRDEFTTLFTKGGALSELIIELWHLNAKKPRFQKNSYFAMALEIYYTPHD